MNRPCLKIISYLLEWRKAVIIKIKGGTSTLTENSPKNWKSNDELLIRLIEVKDDHFLEQKYLDTFFTY